MTDIITLKNVSKYYPSSPHKWAVDKINLEIGTGEFFCLVGPSGCGKSTVLKLIIGIEPPTSGTVERPESIGMVFQSGALLPWLDVSENVSFGLKMTGSSHSKITETTSKYLHLVGLWEERRKYPRELSGGQRQRVGIARALTIEPKVLLLDEPFSALDSLTTDELHHDLLKIWREMKLTVFMVSHLLEEAVFLADRVGAMSSGRLKDVVAVNLPRPRNMRDPAFVNLVDKIKEIIK